MFDAIMGNASKVEVKQLSSELKQIIAEGETVVQAFRLVRDFFVFTDKRLILVDKQGITGKKKEYHSVPYSSITHFSVETAGSFDRDAEMKIWISGDPNPIEREFKKGEDLIIGVQKTLAHYILN